MHRGSGRTGEEEKQAEERERRQRRNVGRGGGEEGEHRSMSKQHFQEQDNFTGGGLSLSSISSPPPFLSLSHLARQLWLARVQWGGKV
ncbi:hypothetical protein EYF80_029575 [Liparis tanakae]|uniref:Uncharacterized protein n=1 Tax=Liparis tanakae TaxID=230148 RepID=A0A4Z2H457_9TELE|nr:hypothetical protein EYF80_029575 [Liparis tanakae]